MQRVRVGQSYSGYRTVLSGVPQGSVLGPILFVMFVNDVSRALEPRTVAKLFADDLKNYMRIDNAGDLDVFNEALCSLQKWSSDWQLPIACAKCSVMRITNRNTEVLGNILIGVCCVM